MTVPPKIKIKRSSVPGKKPSISDVNLGQLALNTFDGELYTRRERTGIGTDIISLGIGATVTNIIYVTQDGKDTNTGKKLGDAKRTIKSALSQATEGTVIKVSAGSYVEDNPLILSKQVSIVGDSLREVSISPQNPDKDFFYVLEGNYVAEMSFTGSLNQGKAIFAFNPDQVGFSSQSPYIQNCTNFIPNSIGMKIDGSKCIGPLKSMVVDSYTQYNQGGIGVSITNEGYAQLVSIFTICNDIAIFCGSGAACDLTNSNSSFGNYALVADGVGPIKYTGIISQSEPTNSFEYVVDLNVPTFNIVSATYDNVLGILTATTNSPHKFSVGMGISIAGLGFTCPSGPGIVTYPSGNKGYVFETVTVAPGRYVDAYNSIQANKREIQDKSLAAIAVEYTGYANTNFYFPGETETNSRSRYYDATRLIQKNKQEIVDKALASIAVGFSTGFKFPDDPDPYKQNRFYDASRLITLNKQEIVDKSLASVAISHPDFYFPGDTQTTPRSRYYDAYRLIQKNKDIIVGIAWTATSNTYPEFNYTETKCKRDIGFFVDAISTDVFTGGNSYSRDFVLQYFNGTTPIGIATTERAPSVFAFQKTRDLMKQAITNTLVGLGTYRFDSNLEKFDSNLIRFNGSYSDLTITPDSITGFNTSPSSCADVQSNIDNLVGIVTVSIGAGNTNAPFPATVNRGYFNLSVGIGTTVSPGGVKCARDLSFLVEAVATDVFTGGNKYSRDFTKQYFDKNGNPISNGLVGETQESITAFNALRDYSKKAITNQLNYKEIGISSGFSTYPNIGTLQPNLPSGNPNACVDVQSNINTLVGIVTTVIGLGTMSYLSTFNENLGISTINKCARDLGYLVDAVSTDIFTGGNKYSRDFTKQYFNKSGVPISNGLLGETAESVYAFKSLGEYAKKAITNQLNYKETDLTVGYSTYPNIGTLQPNLPSGNPNACVDVQSNINTLVGIVTTVIGVGTTGNYAYLSTFSENLGTFTDGVSKCARDIGYIIDAVSTDVRDFTSKNSIEATKAYFKLDGTLLSNGLAGETEQTVVAFDKTRDLMKLAINNNLNNKNPSLVPDPLTGSNTDPESCANVRSFIDNLVGIITTRVGAGNIVGVNTLPIVSAASTQFSVYVGTSTLPHTYSGGGTVKIDVTRPFDGQVIYFDRLYYSINGISITSGGSGYSGNMGVIIESPETSWGIPATAVAEVKNGSVVSVQMISNGRGYTTTPKVTFISPNSGINTATGVANIIPTYYVIEKSTPVSSGICTITLSDNVPYPVGVGTEVPFFKQSRVLASGHSLEYIGSGTNIATALPKGGGVPIQENETDSRNGGLVVFTSTDQSGNFRIGDGVVINQQTGTISGASYSKSLFSTITPFILALGGE